MVGLSSKFRESNENSLQAQVAAFNLLHKQQQQTESQEDAEEYGSETETLYLSDEQMQGIIKCQAVIRGYLTRKLIYESLQ